MKKLLVILLLSLPAFSQGLGNLSLKHFQGVPTGNCSKNTLAENDLTGFLYSCDASQSPPQWSTNSFSGICTGAGNCTISGNLTVASGITYLHNPFNGDGTANAAAGTSNGLLAKLVNTGGVVQIQTLGTSDTTSYPLLVVAQRNTSTNAINGCTAACTTNNAYVAAVGTVAACTFDNTAVVGDFVIDGTTGQCHDTGSATAPTSGTFVGRARTAGTGSQSVSIESQVAGGAGGAPTAITTGYLWLPSGTFPPLTGIVGTVVPSVTAINNINLMQVTVLYPMTFGHASVLFKTQSNQAGAICDFGLYDNTGTKVYSKGGFDCVATATGNVSVTASFTLNPGIYWMASCTSNITATAGAFDGYAAFADVQTTMNQFTQKKYGIITSGCTAGVLPGSITLSSITAANAGIVMQFMEP